MKSKYSLKQHWLNIKNEFLSDKIKFSLKVVIYFLTFILIVTMPIFTYVEKLSLITKVLSAILSIFVLIFVFFRGKLILNTYIVLTIMFAIYATVITCLTTKSFSYVTTIINLCILSCVLFTIIVNFNNFNYMVITFIAGTLLLSILVFADNFNKIINLDFSRFGDTFGNVNTIGSMFAVGMLACFYFILKYRRWCYLLLLLVFDFLLFAILTGSKGSIVSCGLIMMIYLYYFVGKKNIFVYLFLIVLFLVGLVFIMQLDIFEQYWKRITDMFLELFGNSNAITSYSTSQRLSMFNDGIYLWTKNLFFGNGSEYFAIASSYGTYSHSTISETLCNFGIIGFVLLFYPNIKLIFKVKNFDYSSLFIAFFIVFIIFYSFVSIFFYSKYVFLFCSVLQGAKNNLSGEANVEIQYKRKLFIKSTF